MSQPVSMGPRVFVCIQMEFLAANLSNEDLDGPARTSPGLRTRRHPGLNSVQDR